MLERLLTPPPLRHYPAHPPDGGCRTPTLLGAGRFEKFGLPDPEFLGSFVGFFEILGSNDEVAPQRRRAAVTLVPDD
jgi:hypothetical protein